MPAGKGTYGSKVGRPKKKKKKGMSHNEAARKSEGSKLRQSARRLVNKIKKKKS